MEEKKYSALIKIEGKAYLEGRRIFVNIDYVSKRLFPIKNIECAVNYPIYNQLSLMLNAGQEKYVRTYIEGELEHFLHQEFKRLGREIYFLIKVKSVKEKV